MSCVDIAWRKVLYMGCKALHTSCHTCCGCRKFHREACTSKASHRVLCIDVHIPEKNCKDKKFKTTTYQKPGANPFSTGQVEPVPSALLAAARTGVATV